MYELLKKRIEAKIYTFKIFVKAFFYRKRPSVIEGNQISDIFDKYKHKKKIVVLASGPSANTMSLNRDYLYLITNTGNRIVEGYDFLYYLNDNFYIKRALANSFLKPKQEVLFFYAHTELHKIGLDYLLKYIKLLGTMELYFITKRLKDANATDNFIDFEQFYSERNLPLIVQNSGVFLLLFGFYLAHKMSLPIDVYGIDLGIGGTVHFDRKAVVGNSVTKDNVKENVKKYLEYMYKDHIDIKNYSNFYGNMTGFIT